MIWLGILRDSWLRPMCLTSTIALQSLARQLSLVLLDTTAPLESQTASSDCVIPLPLKSSSHDKQPYRGKPSINGPMTQSPNDSILKSHNPLHHLPRNIYAGGGDGVAEFHGVVDFVDDEAALGVFEEIDGHDAAADGFGCAD